MLQLTGAAIVTTAEGKRITYSYSNIDEKGTVLVSNAKRTFIAVDDALKTIIEQLEIKISEHMNTNN